MVTDHLSILEYVEVTKKEIIIKEEFIGEHLMAISERPWFADMTNYKATKTISEEYT